MPFRSDFVWGAGTSAYQVEGAADQGGRGESVWDDFCRAPGRVLQGHSGAVACDHVARSAQDVALMREIGLRAYRFSVSWPRVLPEGVGRVNEAGLAFYDRLVDQLSHPSVAVRELSLMNLLAVDPAAARTPGLTHDVGVAAGMAHDRFVKLWRGRIDEIKKRPPGKA